ncbi:MAG: hypothetical protein HUK21_04780 [Fibrobacteraceae bacterium]|nr:hypothetical protein [Fibrobacteraceae bacterium]
MNVIANKIKCGFTMVVTMVLLSILGTLAMTIYGMVKAERMESFRWFQKDQNELSMETALDYAFYRMENNKEPWRTDSLSYTTNMGNIRFNMGHTQDGLFSKITVFNLDTTKNGAKKEFHPGVTLPPLPAIMLLAPNTDIALVGDAQIRGGVGLKNGRVSYSTHYKMPATKNAYADTIRFGADFAYFDSIGFYPEQTRDVFVQKFEKERCTFDATDALPAELSCKTVVVRGDSKCDGCRIIADRLFVTERASLKKANVISRTISMNQQATVSGAFLAQDSLEINLMNPQNGALWLALQGRKIGDIDYCGYMDVQKLTASNATVIYLADNWDETLRSTPIKIGRNVDLKGAIISKGSMDMQGKLQGYLVAWSFAFYNEETLWNGFLRNAKITGDTAIHIVTPDIVQFGKEAAVAF